MQLTNRESLARAEALEFPVLLKMRHLAIVVISKRITRTVFFFLDYTLFGLNITGTTWQPSQACSLQNHNNCWLRGGAGSGCGKEGSMTSQFTDGAPRVDRPERHVSTEAETLAKVKPIQFLCLN